MTEPFHDVRRPHWVCRIDEQPWPCETARRQLREYYRDDPVGLSMAMAGDLHEAIHDLWALYPDNPPDTPDGLWRRFVAWTRRRTPAEPSPRQPG